MGATSVATAQIVIAVSLCLLLRITCAGPICGCEHRTGLLMELYNATSGPQWTNNAGWGTSIPCTTDWYGVTCASGDITQVVLPSNRLSGTLPAAWSSMSSLRYMYLHVNSLRGTLPASWSIMSSLQDLSLHSNSISGALPATWSSMSSMEQLYLSFNSLSGALPAAWSSMSSLRLLHIASTNLSGTLPPSWSRMSSLRYLYLQSNCLNGTVPTAYAALASHLGNNGVRLCNTNVTGGAAVLGTKLDQGCGAGGDVWPAFCDVAVVQGRVWTNSTSLTREPSASPSVRLSTSPSVAFSGNWSSRPSLTISASPASNTMSHPTTTLSGTRSRSEPSSSTTSASTSASLCTTSSMMVSLSLSSTAVHSRTETPSYTSTHSTWVCTLDSSTVVVALPSLRSSELLLGSRVIAIVSAPGSYGAVQPIEQPAVSTVVSGLIERNILATIPDLAFNLTIAAPPSAVRWAIAHIAMGGQRLNFTAPTPRPGTPLLLGHRRLSMVGLRHGRRCLQTARWGCVSSCCATGSQSLQST